MTTKYSKITAYLLGSVILLLFILACGGETTPTPTQTRSATPAPVPEATTPAQVQPTTTPTMTLVAAEKPSYGGTIRYTLAPGMKDLDPRHYVAYREKHVQFNVYDGLVEVDTQLNIIPDLAESWEISGGGKRIEFKLRRGIKFHDGTEFNAEAVKWNIDYILNEDNISTSRAGIEPAISNTQVVDPYTVRLNLKSAWRPFIATLALTDQLIVSPSATEQRQHPVGTGPFKFKEWFVGNHLIITRNESYRKEGLPYVDTVIFQFAPDKSVQLAMLRTGESDVVDEVAGTDLPLLQGNPNINIEPFETHSWWNLYFKITEEPYDNKALREAVFYALDKQKIVDVQLAGNGRPAWTTFGFSWWGDNSFEPQKYNPQKAKEKLAEAGYPNGVTLPYWCTATDRELRECEIIQAVLADVGIDLEIKPVAAEEYRSFRATECRFCKMGYFLRGDPEFSHRFLLHSSGTSARSRVGYSNPEVDRLIDEAAGIYDTVKAGQMYIEAQKIAFEEAFYTGLYFPTNYAALSKDVQNWAWWSDTYIRFEELWFRR